MRKSIFNAVLMLVMSGALGVFAQTEETNLLANGGFAQCKSGDAIPVNGWSFKYNKEVKGKFIKEASFKGTGPVLEAVNPVKDDDFSVVQSKAAFEIKEHGKYRASVWVKAGDDAKALPKKKFTVRMRTIKTNWKNAFHDKPQMLQKDWLKYEYEFYVPEKELGRYFFRIDIVGSGTFYIANPSIILIAEPVAGKNTGSKQK